MSSYDPSTPPSPMPVGGDRIDIVIAMLRDLDRKLGRIASEVADHEADLRAYRERIDSMKEDASDFKKRLGVLETRKKPLSPEPHWAYRGVAISLFSALFIVVMNWVLKGGLANGVGH